MKGRAVLITIGVFFAALIVVMLSSFGVPPLFSSAWILLIAAVAIITRQGLYDVDTDWPPQEEKPLRRGSDVSRLSWAINARTGIVAIGLSRRIDALARHRLAVRGLDLDDPGDAARIDALFGGPWARETLSAKELSHAETDRLLDLIEHTSPVPEKTPALAIPPQTGSHHDGAA